MEKLTAFYDREYRSDRYCTARLPQEHSFCRELKTLIDRHQLFRKRCLEVGCGRGAFQDLVDDYTGVDISESVQPYIRKRFFRASATELPFQESEFDALWTIAVLEHVPQPERALEEIRRVVKPNGILFLAPAWQCRPWTAEGYPVRPYSDLDLKGKLIKASIPIRDSVLFRSSYVLPRRLARYLGWRKEKRPTAFLYRELAANYDHFWMSDSDAVNSMDPYEAILWFVSRGDDCLSHIGRSSQLLVRTGALVFRIRK